MEETFIKTLQKNNKYITDDRLTLFRYLNESHTPLSIQEIAISLVNSMDEATVYRNIRIFEKLGIATRVYTGWKYKVELSDQYSHHHHHMMCTNCETIISFEESAVFQQELKKIEKKYGFKAESHSLELKGLCKDCC